MSAHNQMYKIALLYQSFQLDHLAHNDNKVRCGFDIPLVMNTNNFTVNIVENLELKVQSSTRWIQVTSISTKAGSQPIE